MGPTTSAPSTSPSKSPTNSPSKSPTSSPSSAPTWETFLLKIDGFHGSPIDALSNDAKSQRRAVVDRVNYVLRRLKEAEQYKVLGNYIFSLGLASGNQIFMLLLQGLWRAPVDATLSS